jgi:predicted TIM-barrel fold metal-dependent hydrolase
MALSREILDLVEKTPFVDTHEHLIEESARVESLTGTDPKRPPTDFSVFFAHYANSDLVVAGMSMEEHERLFAHDTPLDEKWRIVAPVYARTRNTGYLRNMRESLRMLFDEDDLTEANYDRITERIRGAIKPGYYRPVLRETARIEHAQVNALDVPVFRATEYPDLLAQDISFVGLSTGLNVGPISESMGREVKDLKDWHAVIDWCFATYGPRAIAVKNQSAYSRRLDYAPVEAEEAAPLFERYIRDKASLAPEELKAVQDHLFHYCVDRATEHGLPVKLHTGYYAGHGHMPLHRVGANAGDMCDLLKAHPNTKFVIMHITYPYQDEAIAIAKHYPNAYVDLCWAWIMNPVAGVRFVKEFLMAAPANKLLTFGGDYLYVEMVPGHAKIARRGLAQALSELVDEGWIDSKEVPDLVERLMRGNAHALFDYEGTLTHWGISAADAENLVAGSMAI